MCLAVATRYGSRCAFSIKHVKLPEVLLAHLHEGLDRQPELADEIKKVKTWLDVREYQMSRDQQPLEAGLQHSSTASRDLPEPERIEQAPAPAD